MNISPCPNPECGEACHIHFGSQSGIYVMCHECGYTGPDVSYSEKKDEQKAANRAIRLHNLICQRTPPAASAPAAPVAVAKTEITENHMHNDIHPKTPIEIAAQLWCLPKHSKLTMDVEFGESIAAAIEKEQRHTDAWYETAAQFARNADFYRGIVRQIGEMFGKDAYTSDDGSVQDHVLALKVPELVAALIAAPPAPTLEGIDVPKGVSLPGFVNCVRSLVKWHSEHGTMHADCASDFNEALATFPPNYGAPSGEVVNEASESKHITPMQATEKES